MCFRSLLQSCLSKKLEVCFAHDGWHEQCTDTVVHYPGMYNECSSSMMSVSQMGVYATPSMQKFKHKMMGHESLQLYRIAARAFPPGDT